MNRSLKSALKVSVLSALAIAPVVMAVNSASADPGKKSPYVAAGASVGFTKNGGSDTPFAGTIQGTVPLQVVPLTARGTVNFNNDTSSVTPQLTYDLGLTKNVNLYVGGGANLVQNKGQETTLGNQNAPVAVIGAEARINNSAVIYGDVKAGFDAFQGSDKKTAINATLGAGIQF